MNLTKRIEALVYLGEMLRLKDEDLTAVQLLSKHKNNWFTPENSDRTLQNMVDNFLQKEKLYAWAKQYEISETTLPKNIGVILSGSQPLAGFHDLLAVFVSGHYAQIKLSKSDEHLIPHLIKIMQTGFPKVEKYFSFAERMTGFEAMIASGSRDSVRPYKTYFSKIPNIIRDNKFGIAVLDSNETKDNLSNLGKDIFHYFGLSNRSVSKIYIPKNYDFVPLLEATHEYNEIIHNNKYKNNFDFNYTLQIINKMKYKANGCIMIIEDKALQSRVAMLHYEVYDNEQHLNELLQKKSAEIQHIISNNNFPNFKNKDFGRAHFVQLDDYENEIDTMRFLKMNLGNE